VARHHDWQTINISKQSCAPPIGRYNTIIEATVPRLNWTLDYSNFHKDATPTVTDKY